MSIFTLCIYMYVFIYLRWEFLKTFFMEVLVKEDKHKRLTIGEKENIYKMMIYN